MTASRPHPDLFRDVPIGRDFAVLAIHGPQVEVGSADPLDLGDGLSAFFGTDQSLPEHWVKWLGTQQSKAFSESELILRYVPAAAVVVSYKEMFDKLRAVFYGILLQGLPSISSALLLAALPTSCSMEIPSVAPMLPHYRTKEQYPARITADTIRRAASIGHNLQLIHRSRNRLRRGLHAWLVGVLHSDGLFSLHQFVRAVEAAVFLSKGMGVNEFVKRAQFFIGKSDLSETRLKEMRRLRDADEHLK